MRTASLIKSLVEAGGPKRMTEKMYDVAQFEPDVVLNDPIPEKDTNLPSGYESFVIGGDKGDVLFQASENLPGNKVRLYGVSLRSYDDLTPDEVNDYINEIIGQSVDSIDWEAFTGMTKGQKYEPSAEAQDVPTKHQMKIAKDTLRMSDVGAKIAGGMTHDEARAFLKKQGWSDQRIKDYEQAEDTTEQDDPAYMRQVHGQEKMDALEQMVDSEGLGGLAEMLSQIAYEKAEHVRTNWQDEPLAKSWEKDGQELDATASKVQN